MGRSPCIFRRHCAPKRNAVSRECVVSAAPLAQFTSASRLRLPRGGDKARPQVLIQSCNARVTTSGPPSERTWRSGTAASFMKEVKSQFPPIWRSFRYTDIKLNGRAALVVVGPVWPFDPYPVEGASTRGVSDLARRPTRPSHFFPQLGKLSAVAAFLFTNAIRGFSSRGLSALDPVPPWIDVRGAASHQSRRLSKPFSHSHKQ